jgi:hypothetical protein
MHKWINIQDKNVDIIDDKDVDLKLNINGKGDAENLNKNSSSNLDLDLQFNNHDGLDDILNLDKDINNDFNNNDQETFTKENINQTVNDLEFLNDDQNNKVINNNNFELLDNDIETNIFDNAKSKPGDQIHIDKLLILDKYFDFFKLVINYN